MPGAAAAAHGAARGDGSGSKSLPAKARSSYSAADKSQPEGSSAKTEPSVPLLSAMPPKSMRVFEGPMEKKAISSSGIKWQGRYATLTDFHLGFARQLDAKSDEAMHWMHSKELPTSVSTLEEVFKRVDVDGNGTLDLEEAKACLIELNLYSNDQVSMCSVQLTMCLVQLTTGL